MATRKGYTRFVYWAKVGLPLVALVLVSTIFLIDQDKMTFSTDVFGDLATDISFEEGILLPRINGETASGEPFVFTAEFAVPNGPQISLENVSVKLTQSNDTEVELLAQTGVYTSRNKTLVIDRALTVVSRPNYRLQTTSGIFDLGQGSFSLPQPIAIDSPQGMLTAGSARSEVNSDGTNMIWFEGGVTIVVNPNTLNGEN